MPQEVLLTSQVGDTTYLGGVDLLPASHLPHTLPLQLTRHSVPWVKFPQGWPITSGNITLPSTSRWSQASWRQCPPEGRCHYYSGLLDARRAKERGGRGKDEGPWVPEATLPKKTFDTVECSSQRHPDTTLSGLRLKMLLLDTDRASNMPWGHLSPFLPNFPSSTPWP